MLAGVAFEPPGLLSLSIRKRLPSADTSYDRGGSGVEYFVSKTFAGLPALNVDPAVSTGTAVSVFEASR